MKTKAQLLRDAKSGRLRTVISYHASFDGRKLPDRLQGVRPIVDANSVAIFFGCGDGGRSACYLPTAKLIDYDDDHISIYSPGYRKPTPAEARALDDWEKIAERPDYKRQLETDCLTDGSTTYYMRKRFFADRDMLYLLGYEKQRGCILDRNRLDLPDFIKDDSVRGELSIRYDIISERNSQ